MSIDDQPRITLNEIELDVFIKSFEKSKITMDDVGATVIFVGSVRNFNKNYKVIGMRYESYVKMAEETIKNIEIFVQKKWKIKIIKIIHRIGELRVGDNSIVIAVSTSHSVDGFEACQFILNKIKQDVPIWKNESLSDGTTKWI